MPKYCRRICTTLIDVVLVIIFIFCIAVDAAGGGGGGIRTRPTRWLKDAVEPRRLTGCWTQPWICNRGEKTFRWKMMCCRNKCVNVSSDPYNCGFCGIRCPFTWQCCKGFCVDTNFNPFNCGQCSKRCPFGSLCLYGMCGYSQAAPPLPPFPFPFPPFPFPPLKPTPSKLPHPPHPPDHPPHSEK